MSNLNDLPILIACAGNCGDWVAPEQAVVIGRQELGTGMGIYAPVRLCPACAQKRQPKIERKAPTAPTAPTASPASKAGPRKKA